jgi:hypothetical protein
MFGSWRHDEVVAVQIIRLLWQRFEHVQLLDHKPALKSSEGQLVTWRRAGREGFADLARRPQAMGGVSDAWAALDEKSLWGMTPIVQDLQSEGGVAGQTGSLTTTFTKIGSWTRSNHIVVYRVRPDAIHGRKTIGKEA